MSVFLLIVSLAVILAGCELFVNGIEWFGRRLKLGEGAVGSVLAAVGTAPARHRRESGAEGPVSPP
jgi:cation:H+ antiporter